MRGLTIGSGARLREPRKLTDAQTLRALAHPVRIALDEELAYGGTWPIIVIWIAITFINMAIFRTGRPSRRDRRSRTDRPAGCPGSMRHLGK